MGADDKPLPQWVVDDLAKSGIMPDLFASLGIRHVPSAEYPDLLGIPSGKLPDGYAIPYFDPVTGEQMATADGRPFCRVKLANKVPTSDGTMKYVSLRDGGQHAYIPLAARESLKDADTLILTEGEKRRSAPRKTKYPLSGCQGTTDGKIR